METTKITIECGNVKINIDSTTDQKVYTISATTEEIDLNRAIHIEHPNHKIDSKTKTCIRCGATFTSKVASRQYCYNVNCLKGNKKMKKAKKEIKEETEKPKEKQEAHNILPEKPSASPMPKGMKACESCGRMYIPNSNNQRKCNPNCTPITEDQKKFLHEQIYGSRTGKKNEEPDND